MSGFGANMNKNSLTELDNRHSMNFDQIPQLASVEELKFNTSAQ